MLSATTAPPVFLIFWNYVDVYFKHLSSVLLVWLSPTVKVLWLTYQLTCVLLQDRYWRKNLNEEEGDFFCFGVDLNRNYDVSWLSEYKDMVLIVITLSGWMVQTCMIINMNNMEVIMCRSEYMYFINYWHHNGHITWQGRISKESRKCPVIQHHHNGHIEPASRVSTEMTRVSHSCLWHQSPIQTLLWTERVTFNSFQYTIKLNNHEKED